MITDNKSLTTFVRVPAEGFYARWQMEMTSSNISINYIMGELNKIPDILSRNAFPDHECKGDATLDSFGYMDIDMKQWLWTDSKGGYQEFLKR